METINLVTDVLVVGAGMTGVKAASEIAASGYRVVLIDEGAGLGMAAGASAADLDGEEQSALKALLETINGSEMIDVMTGTRMDGATGFPGNRWLSCWVWPRTATPWFLNGS
jgi:heterodisulfide reductase subunit A-like polyferredoxin